MRAMTANQRAMMEHALGPRTKPAYRNHYCIGVDSPDAQEWLDLVAKGYAHTSQTINDGRDAIFHVTEEGKRVIGRGEK